MPDTYKLGPVVTLASTELDTLANNAGALGPAIDALGVGAGYPMIELSLLVDFPVAPQLIPVLDGHGEPTGAQYKPGLVNAWFLPAIDGTDFEDGGPGVTPVRSPDAVFPLRAVTGPQRVNMGGPVPVPPGLFRTFLENVNTGESFASSGNVLTGRFVTRQG